MTLRDYENRLRVLFQQLKIYSRYPDSFRKKLDGQKAVNEWIDTVLDEINTIQSIIKNLKNDKNK